MAGGRNARQKRQRPDVAAPAPRGAMSEDVLLGDGQRRVVCVLFGAGLALAAVGLFMPPTGAAYWIAFAAAPAVAALAGYLLGGGPGRAFDTWLLTGGKPKETPRPLPPDALPDPARLALHTAMLPALLAELAGAAGTMAPRQQAAARALAEAGTTAPAGQARDAIARGLPRLIPGLAAGSDGAAAEAEALAARLAQGRGGTP